MAGTHRSLSIVVISGSLLSTFFKYVILTPAVGAEVEAASRAGYQ